jgi:hypothetical protein
MIVSNSVYSYNAFIFTVGFTLPVTIIVATSCAILRYVKKVRYSLLKGQSHETSSASSNRVQISTNPIIEIKGTVSRNKLLIFTIVFALPLSIIVATSFAHPPG